MSSHITDSPQIMLALKKNVKAVITKRLLNPIKVRVGEVF